MTKWNSFVPTSYKKASIVTMIQRALAICSTYSSLAIEFENIRQIGLHNGYPLSFIDTRIGIGLSKHLKKSTTPGNTIVGCEKKRCISRYLILVQLPIHLRTNYLVSPEKFVPNLMFVFSPGLHHQFKRFLIPKTLYQNTCNPT